MNEHRFLVGDTNKSYITFLVFANSVSEAVCKANQAFSSLAEGNHIYMGLTIRDAHVIISEDMRVDESMIVEVAPVKHVLPGEVYDYLIGDGYEYSGDKDALMNDEEPSFAQALENKDGWIYAFLRVEARYDYNIMDWSFHVHAFLYPTASGRMVDGDGGAYYKVDFSDAQAFTTFSELPRILKIYERKFKDLILALRDADPIDGLPA